MPAGSHRELWPVCIGQWQGAIEASPQEKAGHVPAIWGWQARGLIIFPPRLNFPVDPGRTLFSIWTTSVLLRNLLSAVCLWIRARLPLLDPRIPPAHGSLRIAATVSDSTVSQCFGRLTTDFLRTRTTPACLTDYSRPLSETRPLVLRIFDPQDRKNGRRSEGHLLPLPPDPASVHHTMVRLAAAVELARAPD